MVLKKADESDEDEMVRQVALGRLWLAENQTIIDGLRTILKHIKTILQVFQQLFVAWF